MLDLQRQAQVASAATPVDTGLSQEKIRFRYAVSGSNPPWKPLRAFDDGEKVYIQFPAGIAQGELPPLFVTGAQGDGQEAAARADPQNGVPEADHCVPRQPKKGLGPPRIAPYTDLWSSRRCGDADPAHA